MGKTNTLRPATNVHTLVASGRLDATTSFDLRHRIADALEAGNNRIVFDLRDVEFVDSAALAALASGMKKARAAGGDLRLMYPASADARRVFSLTRFDQVFVAVEPTESTVVTW